MASIFDGISDFANSVLDKAPAVISALNSGSVAKAQAAQASANQVVTAQKPFVMPTWVAPVAIGLGSLLGLLLILRALAPSKK